MPLPRTFDRTSHASWISAASTIQDWLLEVVHDHDATERTWGLDFFWMAYFAAYPFWPNVRSTRWHSSITLKDTWGDRWISSHVDPEDMHDPECDSNCEACIARRLDIWEEFLSKIPLYHHGPIVSQD